MNPPDDGGEDSPSAGAPQGLSARARRLGDALRARVAIDTRSLAVVRILLGIVLILDLAHRAQDLTRYYTDEGVFPAAAYFARSLSDLSLHAISGEAWVQAVLFIVAGLLALVFTLGYRTRLVGVVCLLLLFSLHIRNPFVHNGGDRLLRVLLLVSLVTPLGERWSIDALRRGSGRSQVATFGTAALLIQPIVVFTTNAILKHRGDRWFAGEGLAMALHNEPMTTALGQALADQGLLLIVLNYGWVVLLIGSALLLLAPTGWLRALVALGYISAFAGMGLTMKVGWFPLLLTASVVPFLTAPFWDAVARKSWPAWKTIGARIPDALHPSRLGRRWSRAGSQDQDPDRDASMTGSLARGAKGTVGVVVLAWILLFSTTHVTPLDPPDPIDISYLDQQAWALFAPDPAGSYGLYVVEAELGNGSSPETRTLDPLDLDPVLEPPDGFDTFRDRKFMQAVWSSSRDETPLVAGSYADWVCRQAEHGLEGTVESITVVRINHQITLDAEPPEPRRIVVIERDCATR